MKDIDFDELDRAVSSVLGQASPKSDAVTSPSEKPDESQAENTPAETPAPVVPETASEPASSPTPPLAVKRRGKFMDVMHPSADMTPSSPVSAAKPARTAPDIKPISSDGVGIVPEETEAATDQLIEPTAELDESHTLIGAEPAPVESLLPEHVADTEAITDKPADTEVTSPAAATADETTSSTEEPTADENTTSSQSLYVDPLEMIQPGDTQPSDSDKTEAGEVSDVAAPEEQASPATPFLTDTKVDKRPLGAFGDADAAAAPAASGADAAGASGLPPADTQAAPTVPLPRELQPDVVEVESSAQEAETTQPVPAVAETSESKSDTGDDGRVEGHPLFDTSTYHEPIAAVHGTSVPGWVKWLIGLLVCLGLGAGVGYFLFTAGL